MKKAMSLGLCAWLAVAAAGPVLSAPFSDDDYAAVLTGFVDDEGLVDYASLKQQRTLLDAYVASLETLDPSVHAGWNEKQRIAFWINAYNALTLRMIVDHYPIEPSQPKPAYPKRSIRQIPGVWDSSPVVVMGRKMTLDEIEHGVLRREFREPRIHMALVCAALSCPKLRREPYRGAALDAQLDEQARTFMTDPRNFLIDRERNEVWATEILKWFADDFVPVDSRKNERHVVEREALVAFASKYAGETARTFLAGKDYAIQYFKYDWTLNEQNH